MANAPTNFHDGGHREEAYKVASPIPQAVDPKAERRVLWKVDLLLMPILTFSYGLQFVSIIALKLP